MKEDFNIKGAEWDPSVLLHPVASQTLRDLADFYSLVHSLPVLSVPITTQTLVAMLIQ